MSAAGFAERRDTGRCGPHEGPDRFGICYTRTMRFLLLSLMAAAVGVPHLYAQQTGGPAAGAQVVLQAQGDGVQIYTCGSSAGAMKWTLKGPDAKLLDASGQLIGTHFAGPTWKLNDGSQVQGELIANQPSPETGSVAWLLLRAKAGSATGTLANVAFIRRTETHGGAAPATGCDNLQDSGKTVQVHYTATYTFYSGSAPK